MKKCNIPFGCLLALTCLAVLVVCVGCASNKNNSESTDHSGHADVPGTTEASTDATEAPTQESNPMTDLLQFSVKTEPIKSESLNTPTKIISENTYKISVAQNPLITNQFCADPTAVEYNGRLYVYGTNDHQQYKLGGKDGQNTYEKIKSLVVMSTDDMVNWVYHGEINVKSIAPWIYASWAPSIVSRVEEDGLTHFYLYFSNSGAGVGVITATDPLGPWTDPLGKPLIDPNTPTLGDCEAPFDPGVCIDDNGVGWLSFGGGDNNSTGTDYMPGNARIVQLGDDMISLASDIAVINAPYHFEANELNFINGTYVYTYNTSWKERTEWYGDEDTKPTSCSMCYMTTKTPLDTDSWVYQDYYFKNPGEQGMEYSNNHTHLQKFNGKYYLFYHTLILQRSMGITGGFRSICVNEAIVDEETLTIEEVIGYSGGCEQYTLVDPYTPQPSEMMVNSADIKYENYMGNIVTTGPDGAWIRVNGVDFGDGAAYFAAKVRGTGKIEVRLDRITSKPVAEIVFSDLTDWTALYNTTEIYGEHDVFFILVGDDVLFDEWQFVKQ